MAKLLQSCTDKFFECIMEQKAGNGTMTMLKTVSFFLTTLVTLGVLIGMIAGYFDYLADVKVIKTNIVEIKQKLECIPEIDSRLTLIEYLHGINIPKDGDKSKTK